ncbi:hypothetical protein C4559_05735 [Candidatus Microgenomates bacterium]|nr:MAG: hypothetical protein C4559_05735 [Candidatus Microgenomates bacterium]
MDNQGNLSSNNSSEKVLHSFDQSNGSLISKNLILFLIVIIFAGIGSGYFLSKNNLKVNSGSTIISDNGGSVSKGTVIGSNDTKTFKDDAQGVLKEGGIEGEGQFHLVRPGGDSQDVYLISSVVDLAKFKDKKIKVWGQTQKAQKAAWLMDVGRLEVLE